jgi:hypothetical protein
MAYDSYYCTTPSLGVNLKGSYLLGVAGAQLPTQYDQEGMKPGTVIQGNKNTRWMYALTGPIMATTVPGTSVNINPTTFVTITGAGTAGTPIVAAPPNTGAWFEISTATLSPTSLSDEPIQRGGESDEDYRERVRRAHAQVGEKPDGSPLDDDDPAFPEYRRGNTQPDRAEDTDRRVNERSGKRDPNLIAGPGEHREDADAVTKDEERHPHAEQQPSHKRGNVQPEREDDRRHQATQQPAERDRHGAAHDKDHKPGK